MFWSDEPVSPMGLVQQHQFCKPGLPAEIRCTPLLSRQDAYDAAVMGINHQDPDDTAHGSSAAADPSAYHGQICGEWDHRPPPPT